MGYLQLSTENQLGKINRNYNFGAPCEIMWVLIKYIYINICIKTCHFVYLVSVKMFDGVVNILTSTIGCGERRRAAPPSANQHRAPNEEINVCLAHSYTFFGCCCIFLASLGFLIWCMVFCWFDLFSTWCKVYLLLLDYKYVSILYFYYFLHYINK